MYDNKVLLADIDWMLLNNNNFVPLITNITNTKIKNAITDEIIFENLDINGKEKRFNPLASQPFQVVHALKEKYMSNSVQFLSLFDLDLFLEYSPLLKFFFNNIAKTTYYGKPSDKYRLLGSYISKNQLESFTKLLNRGAETKFDNEMHR